MSFEDVVEFLLNPDTYGPGTTVKTVQTHAAIVFLAGDSAYKVKRPVCYDYLDFSTLEKRRAMLQRELELNKPGAPEIYLGLVPVTRQTKDGGLQIGGDGEVVEWCLHMRRFSEGSELSAVAQREGISRTLAEEIGRTIAQYHARAAISDLDGRVLVTEVAHELNQAFSGMVDVLGASQTDQFRQLSAAAIAAHAPLLSGRSQQGFVRRGHGDLHLGNMVLLDGAPVLFDALEFDERLGTLDVLYDLAFIVMDLLHHGQDDAANAVLSAYLYYARVPEHYSGLVLLPLFLGLRAGIRAMVAVQAVGVAEDVAKTEKVDAKAYLDHALDYLTPPAPRLVVIGGYSGTGKTTLARHLAAHIGAVPGAIHLRSDLERKALLGVDPLSPLPQSAYSEAIGKRVYARILEQAGRILHAGHSVILDAVYARPEERASVAELARECGAEFTGLWLTADAQTLMSRVSKRRNDASDADETVVRKQLERGEQATEWTQIDASGSIASVVERALAVL